MSILSNARLHPRTNAVAWRIMDAEIHTIAVFPEYPGLYGFQTRDQIQPGTITFTENVTGGATFTIVLTDPLPGQVYVNYTTGRCLFNVADSGTEIITNGYMGGGSNASIQNISTFATLIGQTTDDLVEGVTNLYYTDARPPAAIHSAASKATPVDADEIGLIDSAAAWVLKKLTWANLKATLSLVFAPLSGSTIQSIFQPNSATDSTSSNIPNDNTKPQITEGKEYFSQSITPTNASNLLRIEWNLNVTDLNVGGIIQVTALFKDSGPDALCTTRQGADDNGPTNLSHYGVFEMIAGSTSPIVFSIRYGAQSGITYINTVSGAVTFDGTLFSWIRVSEIAT